MYVYTYTCNIRAPKYIKQILTYLKGGHIQQSNNSKGLKYPTFSNEEIIQTENTGLVRNTGLEPYTNPNTFKRTFHPTEAEYTFISGAHGTFSRIDCMIVTK